MKGKGRRGTRKKKGQNKRRKEGMGNREEGFEEEARNEKGRREGLWKGEKEQGKTGGKGRK